MVAAILVFLVICFAFQAFGGIIGFGAVIVKEVRDHHQMGKDPLVAARRTKNDKKVRKFMFWAFAGMALFVVWMEMLKAADTPTETPIRDTTTLVNPTPTPTAPTPTPTQTPAPKVAKADSTEWIPKCGFRISYNKGNDEYAVEAKVGEVWKEVFRSSVWFYVQRFVCDKYPETCSKVAVQPAPKSVAVQQSPNRSHSRRREQASNDEERSSYEQRRLEQRMSRPPGTPWRNFSAPDEHGYPNN
jgi:hypothetical protein